MKKLEAQLYIELLKRRLASLRLMAKELHDCRQSLVSMDLEATREHISYQQGLCAEIRFLDNELRVLRRQMAKAGGLDSEGMGHAAFTKLLDSGSAFQLRHLTEELATAQNHVWRLNRVYGGLLKRSRRSINVLINVMASYMGTYDPSPRRPGSLIARRAGM